jgi:hypothetical protein
MGKPIDLPFDAFVTLWKFQHDPLGGAQHAAGRRLDAGPAIRHVIGRPLEDQWRYEIVTDDLVLDHVDATQIAYTRHFRAWDKD